jgi:hypothetical protein
MATNPATPTLNSPVKPQCRLRPSTMTAKIPAKARKKAA